MNDFPIIFLHNPDCGTSRSVLAMVHEDQKPRRLGGRRHD